MELDEIAAFVFVDIAVIVVVARLMGALFKRIRQPAVVGEILAGILLGPTLLGALPGNLPDHLFPVDVRPYLNILAQLGLILFMFIVGLELDMKLIRGNERTAAVISLTSITLPFALGLGLAAVLHGSHSEVGGAEVDYLPFALFIGASMSITAFPVLARILTERGMYRTPIGALTLASAAVDDIVAWSMLAVVLAVVESKGAWDLPRILLLSIGFVTVMFAMVKPRLALVADRYRQAGRLTPNILSVVLVGVLVSAFITSEIGIHSIFGAFLFGVIMPREATAELFREILERLEQVSVLLLLPVFFIATGLGVDVGGIGLGGLGQLALILVVACVGKFVGAAAGARSQGIPTRKAAAVGVLMNTRGLTELVILNIGVSKGVLDGELFTMLVVMAVFTTVITEPLLRVVYPDKQLARDIAEAERAALGVVDAYRVLVALGDTRDPEAARPLLDVALGLVGGEERAEVVISQFLPYPKAGIEVGSGLVTELAEMAGSLDLLGGLAAEARARGVSCVVLSQFSRDVPGDLVAQAAAVEADVLLTWHGAGAPPLERLSGAGCAVAALSLPAHDRPGWPAGVVTPAGDGADPEAALAAAARLAWSAGAPLVVLDDRGARRVTRRVEQLGAQLRAAGVDFAHPPVAGSVAAELDRRVAAGALAVVGAGDERVGAGSLPLAGPALVVRAGDGHDGSELARLGERLGERRGAPPPLVPQAGETEG